MIIKIFVVLVDEIKNTLIEKLKERTTFRKTDKLFEIITGFVDCRERQKSTVAPYCIHRDVLYSEVDALEVRTQER